MAQGKIERQAEAILLRFQAAEPVAAIARELGCTESGIYKLFHRLGIEITALDGDPEPGWRERLVEGYPDRERRNWMRRQLGMEPEPPG